MSASQELLIKYDSLKLYLKKLEKVAVAYSSGVDSTFLLYAAIDSLGKANAIALTAESASFPVRENDESRAFCTDREIRQIIFEVKEVDEYFDNPVNRCYYCKKGIFSQMVEIAGAENIEYILDGSNKDDDGDYRPGLKAISELGIKSPLRELGFTKQEIRDLSEHFGLPTWDKPSYACLASRVPYGERISDEKLHKIDEAEQYLIDLGFKQIRVRVHGDNLARIELDPDDFARFMQEDFRTNVYNRFREIGYTYISLDLKGYKMGNMNEEIKLL